MKIKTDDGAIGKSLKTTATKTDDSGETICEIKAQMTIKRAEIDFLAGFPPKYSERFYTEDGAPIANMELRFPKRELTVGGKLWRGEPPHAATLPLKKATADALRFKLEPNGAVFICRIAWRAAGDEVEEVKDLLGKWCSIDLDFSDPREKQTKLDLKGGGKKKPADGEGDAHKQTTIDDGAPAPGTEGGRPLRPDENLPPGVPPIRTLGAPPAEDDPGSLRDRLIAQGLAIPDDPRVWFTFSPAQIQSVLKWVKKREDGAGDPGPMPRVLKPFVRPA